MKKIVKVDLPSTSYIIVIGIDILEEIGPHLIKEKFAKNYVIVTDTVVRDLYGKALQKNLMKNNIPCEMVAIPRGEQNKSLKNAAYLYDYLVKLNAHRDTGIIALGGGVIGDLAGFVAATYMRGVPLVHVPTTLLAQVDSSVGGKTSVNHPRCKNLIGSFYQPNLVWTDVKTLVTLDDRELRTGLAEVIKYGVICDYDFFKFLEVNVHHLTAKAFETPEKMAAALKVWQIIVAESCNNKAKVIMKDEKEQHLRMILNFGHTVGHAIETVTKYRRYNHGETVAIGMLAAVMIAERLKVLQMESVQRLRSLLEKLNLPLKVEKINHRSVIKALFIDKKIRDEKLVFVLPKKRLGQVEIIDSVPIKVVKKVLQEVGCS